MDWNKIRILKSKIHESDTGYVYILGTSLEEFDFDDNVIQVINQANWFFNIQIYGVDSRAGNNGTIFYDVNSVLLPRVVYNVMQKCAEYTSDNRVNLREMNWNNIVLVEPGSSWYSDEKFLYPDHMSFKVTIEEWLTTIRGWNQPTKMITYSRFIQDISTHISVASKKVTDDIINHLVSTIKK